jgi:hypothetical protein
MKLVVYIGVGLLALQMPISAAEINTSKILIEHNKKLNQLKKTNKDLILLFLSLYFSYLE